MTLEEIKKHLLYLAASDLDLNGLRIACVKLANSLNEKASSEPMAMRDKKPGPTVGEFARELLMAQLPVISDFDSFVFDNFREVHAKFGNGMDRTQKTDMLLAQAGENSVIADLLYGKLKETRTVLNAALPTNAEFDAFALEQFPLVHQRFGGGMDRISKTSILLQCASAGRIAVALHNHNADLAMRSVRLWR